MLVAATPANSATSKVLKICVVAGGSGCISTPKTTQNGKLPRVMSQILLKAFCRSVVSIAGIRAMRFCKVEEGLASMVGFVFNVMLLCTGLFIAVDKS